jgi:uncharacterized protein (DUF1800 family)
MADDQKFEAASALHRFGFGPRAGSIAAIASDPRGALLAELERPASGRISNSDLLTSSEAARAAFEFRQVQRAARLAQRAEREMNKNTANNAVPPAGTQAPAVDSGGMEVKPGQGAANTGGQQYAEQLRQRCAIRVRAFRSRFIGTGAGRRGAAGSGRITGPAAEDRGRSANLSQ